MSTSNPQMPDMASLMAQSQNRSVVFALSFNSSKSGSPLVDIVEHQISDFAGMSSRTVANSLARAFCSRHGIDFIYIPDVKVYTCTLL